MRRSKRRLGVALVDLVVTAVLIGLFIMVSLAVLVIALGDEVVVLKQGLFVIGILLSGAATLRLRGDLKRYDGANGDDSSRTVPHGESRSALGSAVEFLIPEAWRPPSKERFSSVSKLAVTGVLLLLTSLLLEIAFGV